jgi:hypothetical protein
VGGPWCARCARRPWRSARRQVREWTAWGRAAGGSWNQSWTQLQDTVASIDAGDPPKAQVEQQGHHSGWRGPASGGGSAGSNPAGGAIFSQHKPPFRPGLMGRGGRPRVSGSVQRYPVVNGGSHPIRVQARPTESDSRASPAAAVGAPAPRWTRQRFATYRVLSCGTLTPALPASTTGVADS